MKKYLYVSTKLYNQLHLDRFPSTGRYGNVSGMRKMFWGDEAYVIRCGAYAYKVDYQTFATALDLVSTFKLDY